MIEDKHVFMSHSPIDRAEPPPSRLYCYTHTIDRRQIYFNHQHIVTRWPQSPPWPSIQPARDPLDGRQANARPQSVTRRGYVAGLRWPRHSIVPRWAAMILQLLFHCVFVCPFSIDCRRVV